MRRALFPILAFVALVVIGCGGGGGSVLNPGLISPTGTPTPHPGPTTIIPTPSSQEVIISGAGYTLKFTLPALTVGSAASVTAVVQATPPPGVPALASLARSPRAIGGAPVGLVYLTLSTTAGVGFAALPSFVWTLPSASVIPPGSTAFMSFYDPAAGQWQATHLSTSTPSGATLSFPGAAGGFSLAANAQYVYALTTNTTVPPTPTPAPVPTATPSPAPTPAVAPAYCGSSFADTATAGLTLNITDSSGLTGAALIAYVSSQGPPQMWMNGQGSFTSATPVALPAACYSSTLGSAVKNNPLVIPGGYMGRVWFVYASPAPTSATAPNPLSSLTAGAQPNIGVGQAPYLYDKLEFNSTSGVIDTTQVDFIGLPLEMNAIQGAGTPATPLPQALPSSCPASVPTATPFSGIPTSPTVVGVGQCGFAAIFTKLSSDPVYGSLVSILPWNSTQTIDFRAVAPAKGQSFTPFDFNVFGDPNVTLPSACQTLVGSSTGTYGYMSCVIAQYQAHPQVYQALAALGGNGDGDYFCVSSDGSSNFTLTDIGTNTTCGSAHKALTATLPANPFQMPVALFTNLIIPSGDTSAGSCQYGEFFATPWGNANVDQYYGVPITSLHHVFATADAFTLWKALILEMNYGTAFSTGPHPVESTPPSLQPPLFSDPASNNYAKIVHSYFDGNYAYAIGYDDAYQWFSGYSIAGGTINVRVNPIPTAAPATNPNPVATSNPTCATITPDVGSY